MIRITVMMFRQISRNPKAGFGFLLAILGISILGNAATFYLFEQTAEKHYTIQDCLWYSMISITTIGYGDYSAQTFGGRMGTVFFIVILGMAAFTIFLGIVTDWMLNQILKGQRGMGTVIADGHILIVNFPGEASVKRVIKELQSDPQHEDREIIIITDQVEQLPFAIKNVHFVHGSPLETDVYERASIDKAAMALILALSYSDPNSDAIVSSEVAIMEKLNPKLLTVAECLDRNHKMLFETTNCDAIVSGLEIAGNLLVQEMQDPGVARVVDEITSNLKGTTLYSVPVPDGSATGMDYQTLAKHLLDHGANLLSVLRGEDSHTTFKGLLPQSGDRVIYVGQNRWNWAELQKQAT
ncbi:potassium channel family protein [Planctomycetota bacterium]